MVTKKKKVVIIDAIVATTVMSSARLYTVTPTPIRVINPYAVIAAS